MSRKFGITGIKLNRENMLFLIFILLGKNLAIIIKQIIFFQILNFLTSFYYIFPFFLPHLYLRFQHQCSPFTCPGSDSRIFIKNLSGITGLFDNEIGQFFTRTSFYIFNFIERRYLIFQQRDTPPISKSMIVIKRP